jgi:hypothetical protein
MLESSSTIKTLSNEPPAIPEFYRTQIFADPRRKLFSPARFLRVIENAQKLL